MSKILKNTTGSAINVADTGITIPASPGQYTIPAQDYWLWAASSDTVTYVGAGDLVVNDGSFDLSISDGIDLVKGIFPNPVTLRGNSDGTSIGNVGDRLKVDAQVTSIPTSFDQYLLDLNVIYSMSVEVNATSSGSDNPLIYMNNPSGSGKKILFLRATANSEISNERTLFKLFSSPTITANGTSYTPKNRNLNNGAGASVILSYTLPTVSSLGTNISIIQSGENTNSQEIVGVQNLMMQPNSKLILSASPKSNNRTQAITIVWAELDI